MGQAAAVDTSTWRRVVTRDGFLSLLLPPDWKVRPPDEDETIVFSAEGPGGYAAPLLYMVYDEFTSYETARDYKLASVLYLQETTPGLQDHGGEEWEVGGQQVSWHGYAVPTEGGALTYRSYYTLACGGAYMLTSGTPADTFPRYRDVLDAIGRSLCPADSTACG